MHLALKLMEQLMFMCCRVWARGGGWLEQSMQLGTVIQVPIALKESLGKDVFVCWQPLGYVLHTRS